MGGRQPMRRLFMLFLMFGLCAAWGQGEKKGSAAPNTRSEEHTSELQSQSNLVCRLLLEKKKNVVDNPLRCGRPGVRLELGQDDSDKLMRTVYSVTVFSPELGWHLLTTSGRPRCHPDIRV